MAKKRTTRKPSPEEQETRAKRRAVAVKFVGLALIVLAGVSVKFIFDRNSIDSANMMSEKISAIQNIIESRSQGLERLGDVEKSEWLNLLQDVAATTRSDISLFNPKGLVHVSTAGEMFSNSLLSCRMDGEAYHSIIQNHQRICIQPETIDGKQFYSLYAPIFNKRGETKTQKDLDKLNLGLEKLAEEDPTFQVESNEETGQTIIMF